MLNASDKFKQLPGNKNICYICNTTAKIIATDIIDSGTEWGLIRH